MYSFADVIFDACVLCGVNTLLWVASLVLGKCWPVDFIWSNWPIAQAIVIYARAGDAEGECTRRLCVFSLVCVWGCRLTLNFVSHGGTCAAFARSGSCVPRSHAGIMGSVGGNAHG